MSDKPKFAFAAVSAQAAAGTPLMLDALGLVEA